MIVRKAKPQDVPAIVELAVESVNIIAPIPELKIDRDAMRETVMLCLQPAHLCLVAEHDGVVVGAVVAQVLPGFWFHKLQCSVLMHYARESGAWVKLMRALAKWVKGRSGIKMALIEVEDCHDPKVLRFIERLGFARPSSNRMYIRGGVQ
ncbi:GNAT family N-acetyltransferase [Vreelandella stevensii]|uniref:GNAT family N-acetyltransferase n=1 Tax=Vreelandella stevensii TaxID=502821 RepID=UPI00403B1A1E